MISEVAKALRIAQEAIAAIQPSDALDADERAALSYVVQSCTFSANLLAGECLLPLHGGIAALLTIADPHERALAALRIAKDRLEKARPLTLASRRTLHGLCFMAEAVLFSLEVAAPEDLAEVRYSIADRTAMTVK